MIKPLVILAVGAIAAIVGFWVGVFAATRLGEFGMDALEWSIGGATAGAAVGVFVAAVALT